MHKITYKLLLLTLMLYGQIILLKKYENMGV